MCEKYQRVYANVDLDVIKSNMDHMKANLKPETKMMAVIKADGYGHGAVPIAHELEGLDYLYGFAVATAEEALTLRENDIRKAILILGYTFPENYEQLILNDIRLTVFRYDTLKQLSEIVTNLKKKGIEKKAHIHIKVDTGMSRIGIRPDETGLDFVKVALETEGLEVEGIFTHFARADELDKSATMKQLDTFRNFLNTIKKRTGVEIPVKHCSNSAGIIEIQDANMDVVRAGISLYGLRPSAQVRTDLVELAPALSLYSKIVFMKEIEEGTEVSYGGTFVAKDKMTIATVPVGYGDGYPRGLSRRGHVLVQGEKAPILGRVCMDQFMIDVTHITNVDLGDKVTLIGHDGNETITIEDLEQMSGGFNYEIACNLSPRIPRVYTKA